MNLSRHLPRFLRDAIVADLERQLVDAERANLSLANKYHAAALELDLAKIDVKRLQGTNDLLRQEVELLDKACANAGDEVESISAENLRLYHDRKVLRRKLDETVALMDESATAMDDARQRIGELEAWVRRAVGLITYIDLTTTHTTDLIDSSPLTDTPSPAGAVCPACGGVGNVSAVDADGRKWAPLCSTCNGKGSLDPSPAGASHGGSEDAAGGAG